MNDRGEEVLRIACALTNGMLLFVSKSRYEKLYTMARA